MQAASDCDIELFVLGAGQDAGAPQIGNHADPAWNDTDKILLPTALGVVDHSSKQRFLFEATPAIGAQLKLLETLISKPLDAQSLDGIFLTHAHIGHYAGLMYLGREAAGVSDIPVYALPRMIAFLSDQGPWSQLVDIGNVILHTLQPDTALQLTKHLSVTALPVPHRDEYSETAGFVIATPQSRTLFIPDIDSWELWQAASDRDIGDMLRDVDFAFVDATFYDDNELPGRDMREIPHPRVTATMARLDALTPDEKSRLHFIHYNHTNPIRFSDSDASAAVAKRGFRIARRGDRFCLLSGD
ncbi:MAG: MBL fold metallo-hydrolase [Pseudomonadota bacterium]